MSEISKPIEDEDFFSRWALVRQVRAHPDKQDQLWLALGLWLVSVVLCMVAIGGGNPFSFLPILVLGVDLIALGIMLATWPSMNTGWILGAHAAAACLALVPFAIPALAVVSVAVMFGAAEAGQNWWALIADEDEDGATIIAPPDRRLASLEVIAIAGAAALLVAMLGVFESRVATLAAIALFVALVIGTIVLRRGD